MRSICRSCSYAGSMPCAGTSSELAVQDHHIQSAISPAISIHDLVKAESPVMPEFSGRPIHVWGKCPELARQINDKLSAQRPN